MFLSFYTTLTRYTTPFLERYLARRELRGKEDPERRDERRGLSHRRRGTGRLVWCHAASVGEALSLLSVVETVLRIDPATEVMVTTGTVTSAAMMAARLPAGAFHQYVPVDHPDWVARFLDHHKPDLAIWTESEFWPNLLLAMQERDIPAILLNARMSEKTYRRWRWVRGTAARILAAFDVCFAQNEAEAARLQKLGARDVRISGNLKYAAAPLPVDPAARMLLERAIGNRPVVLWTSTHDGEERIAAITHQRLQQVVPDLLTIIAPRHPVRGADIAGMIRGTGLSVARRASDNHDENTIAADTAVYVADTMGELGLLYALCPLVVMGGSFAMVGGHNPIEPAQMGCTVFFGPQFYNFISIMDDFRAVGAVVDVRDENDLAEKLGDALRDPARYAGVGGAARKLADDKAAVLDEIAGYIAPFLTPDRQDGKRA